MLQLLTVALATWAVGSLYTLRINPELAFYRHGYSVKLQWAEHLSQNYSNKMVVFGGSSCATSIEPRRLLERHGIAMVNAGFAAGMGAKLLTLQSFSFLKKGDTLIVALEPDLLSADVKFEPFGVQFALATRQSKLLRNHDRVDWPAALVDLRPGGYHIFTLVGKILLRQPLYRYSNADFEPTGWQKVEIRRDLGTPSISNVHLSTAGKEWLLMIRAECARRGVRVVCAMPWHFATSENLLATQRANLRFLRDVAEVLPVLREPSLGAHSVREHFADTNLHPTPEGAALRTDELATALKAWRLWSLPEMDSHLVSIDIEQKMHDSRLKPHGAAIRRSN